MSIYKIALINQKSTMTKREKKMKSKTPKKNNQQRDWHFFNCYQKSELKYIVNLYKPDNDLILTWLKQKCNNDNLKYETHYKIYNLIAKELGLQKNKKS